MATSTPVTNLSEQSQDMLIQYFRACTAILTTTWNIRERLLNIDRAYMREQDYTKENTRARLANTYGDPTKFQNVVAPVVMPQVEAAVTYQTSVFLTGTPLFGCNASPKFQDAALQMETIIDEQAIQGGWVNQLEMAIRDGYKYNLGAVDIDWCVKKIWTPQTDLTFSRTQGKPQQVLWQGNELKRLDPYNIIFDARYKPTEISARGEFAGYTEAYSRVELIQFMQDLQFRMNYKKAMESGPTTVGTSYPLEYFIPELNPEALLSQNMYQTMNWLTWAGIDTPGGRINYKNVYFVTKLYCKIVPADFRIGAPNAQQPQIWKFWIINGQTIVAAERMTNAHNQLPILFLQPLEDGLGYQTKSFAQNVIPHQQVASALINSAMASRRRALSDRGIYDPSRINAKDINSDSPNAKIAVRPAAYGKPLSEAYYPIPYRDDQLQFAMSDMAQVLKFADQVSGQNPVQQGQFVKGNKTQREFDTVMGNSNGRNQSAAIKLETQFFTPLKEIIKLNILQYQPGVSIYSRTEEKDIAIDPVLLRKAQLTFKVSDGLLPSEKIMSTDAFASATQVIMGTPAIAQTYNIAPLVSYLFKTQRADVAPFEKPPEQIAFEQAMAQWSQTVQTIAESLAKMKDANGNPIPLQQLQQAYPPQPKPQDYGYTPGMVKQGPPEDQSVMAQFTAASQNNTGVPPQAATVGGTPNPNTPQSANPQLSETA